MVLIAKHGEISFSVGDTVRVHQKISEGQRTRTAIFEGTVLAIRGEGENRMFTVRRLGAGGIGIERVFPLYSPLLEKIEVRQKGYPRRAKLYYLRGKPPTAYAELAKPRKTAPAHVKRSSRPARRRGRRPATAKKRV